MLVTPVFHRWTTLNQEGKRQKYIPEVVEISKKVPLLAGIDKMINARGLTKKERFE